MMVTRLFDLVPHMLNNFPRPDAFGGKENGSWQAYSTQQFSEYVNNVSAGLLALGLTKGDKIATLSNNRPEWNFLDLGMLQVGVVHVPVYPTISEHDLEFIFKDAEIKYVFVSTKELYDKVQTAAKSVPSIKKTFTFNKIEGLSSWMEIVDAGKVSYDKAAIEAISNTIKANDLATLLYTSGTTGNPKGVMLSHNNFVSNFQSCKPSVPADEKHRAISFLPLNHVYERMLTYCYMNLGVSIYYAESLETIGDNIRELKPDVFSAVPRLLEKVYDRIMAKGHELQGIKRALFFWAVSLGEKYDPTGGNGFLFDIKLAIARKLIFSKWKEALGGNVRAVVSGGAALSPRLARIFWAAGIPVLEGYGLTETSPVIAVNNFNENSLKIGTVGPVIEGVSVKIAPDGEILCKGPNVMLGYYQRPDLTAEVIDADGYFHTGDIGELVDGRFLKITDRKKEIFKTSGGKYIIPQKIENLLKASPFIEQAMVVGENQKFAAAFIVPAFNFLKDWAAKKGIDIGASNTDIIKNSQVIDRIHQEVEQINKELGNFETIKKFELLPLEFSIDRGDMTPKMSLRRRVILENNKALLESIYAEA